MQKVKYVLAGMLAAALGILVNPEMMAASHSVRVMGMDESRIVETRISPVEKGEFSLVLEEVPEAAVAAENETVAGETSASVAPAPVADVPAAPEVAKQSEEAAAVVGAGRQMARRSQGNSLQILGNTVELRWTSVTTEDAGAAAVGWYYDSGRFIYAHDYGHVLGVMNTAYDRGTLVGTRFDVTMDGVTRYYTVTDAKVYTANVASWKMRSFVSGGGHALAIMTCYGEGRLVVFAD